MQRTALRIRRAGVDRFASPVATVATKIQTRVSRLTGTGAFVVTVADAQALAASVWKDSENLHDDIRGWMEKKHDIDVLPISNLYIGSWDYIGPLTPGSEKEKDVAFVRAWCRFVSEVRLYKSLMDEAWSITYSEYERGEKYQLEQRRFYEQAKKRGVNTTVAPSPTEEEVEDEAGRFPWTWVMVVATLGVGAYALSQTQNIFGRGRMAMW